MRMIRRGDGNSVDIVAIEQPAEIHNFVEFAPAALFQLLRLAVEHPFITIAQRHEVFFESLDVAAPAAVEPDDGHTDLAVNVSPGESRQHRESGGRPCRLAQKRTASWLIHDISRGHG